MEKDVKLWSGTMKKQVKYYSIDDFERWKDEQGEEESCLECDLDNRSEDLSRYFENENKRVVIQGVHQLNIPQRIQDLIIGGSIDSYKSRSERDMACIVTLAAKYNFKTIKAIFTCQHLGVSDRIREKGVQTLIRDYRKALDFNDSNHPGNIESEFRRCTLKELLEEDLPQELGWIEGGILPKSGYQIVAADAKEGKTTFVLQESISLVSGNTFLDRFPVTGTPRVLYIYAEGAIQELQKLLRSQIDGFRNLDWNIGEDSLERLILIDGRSLNLKSPQGFVKLQELIEKNNVDICILDPISLFYTGNLDKIENVAKLISALNRISADVSVAWIVVHHYHKSSEGKVKPIQKITGSAGWGNYCESFLGMEQAHIHRSENFKKITFVLRRAVAPRPLYLSRNPNSRLFSIIENPLLHSAVTVENVVEDLRLHQHEGVSYTDLTNEASQKYGVTPERIAELLREAKNQGLAEKESGRRGKWHVVR